MPTPAEQIGEVAQGVCHAIVAAFREAQPDPENAAKMKQLAAALQQIRDRDCVESTQHPNPTMSIPYALPTIHLNGTGAKQLEKEYHELYLACCKAGDALRNATCNARDFYVQPYGNAAHRQAQYERNQAFRHIEDLKSYAMAWLDRARSDDA